MDPDSPLGTKTLPCKEFCITDDVMNLSDSATITVSNVDGENTGRFRPGQVLAIELSDPNVANGKWIRMFTGRITQVRLSGDISGGENIMLTAMDMGWHLTSCHAAPLDAKGRHIQIKHKTFAQLLDSLIDPTWAVGPYGPNQFLNVFASNDLNRRLKHGRQVIVQNHNPQLGAILPFIQIEPGQAPMDIINTYAQREGWLVNVGANGDIVFFRPNYVDEPMYSLEYHGSKDAASSRNNMVGMPTLTESIDGLYSEVQVWSTVVIPPSVTNSDNPNEAMRHGGYIASENPLPFKRLQVAQDGEAITSDLRKKRAIWAQRKGIFNSWTYECEVDGLSQRSAFFVSDTMITVRDSVHGLDGDYYVQSVNRSVTNNGGEKVRLVLKLAGYLSPALQVLNIGGGVKKSISKKEIERLNKKLVI